jgi:hypothetical protein
MKNGDTLPAGFDRRISEALLRLDKAREAAANNQPTDFWKQCVRDTTGRWALYAQQKSAYDVPYFHGKQETCKTPEEHQYLLVHLDTRRAFYEGLADVPSMNVDDFRNWLETLRAQLEYRKVESVLHEKSITDKHTKIITQEVMPLAKKYEDPYYLGNAHGPILAHFPKESLPYDEVKDGAYYHHYPSLDYADLYLGEALTTLKSLLAEEPSDTREYTYKIAHFFQVLINLHLFAAVNVSLYMNMADGLLELMDIEGIEHGILDFVAFRLQPETFQEYFYDSVLSD